jgi:hypothetical protein
MQRATSGCFPEADIPAAGPPVDYVQGNWLAFSRRANLAA